MNYKVMELTEERQMLLSTEGNVIVFGGPGSGKTTIALLKADREIQIGNLRSGQRVLFLSFARATIARVAQQAGKLLTTESNERLEINTYHGFTWNLLRSHGYLMRNGRNLQLLPPPDAAARLAHIDGDEARFHEKRRLFSVEGLLHFDLFAEIASSLLLRSNSLRRIICDTYPIIILDEFQDTNQDEWSLITALGTGSRLVALADTEQRIYEFRGADPKRIGEFIERYSPATFDFGSENHRSTGTDIAIYGNDLITGANKTKKYNDVSVIRYGFYHGYSQIFPLKTTLLNSVKHQIASGNSEWSIAVLVPTKKMMLQVSDYLSSQADRLPPLDHDVALDTEGPALAASMIASLLEGATTPSEIVRCLVNNLCTYIRGRKGTSQPTQNELALVDALHQFLKTGRIRGNKRQRIVETARRIAEQRVELRLTGDPGNDWLSIRNMLSLCGVEEFTFAAEDAKYLRLLHKGAVLRSRLGELWRSSGSYAGAATAVRDALLQEHFSASIKEWRGVHVMTLHKSKGKEFSEVIIFEGSYSGRILRASADDRATTQARLTLRVGVTRAMRRAIILTPKQDPCPFL
jgi:DNA helicase-2/ATP-dependent DNA helicase PcrA